MHVASPPLPASPPSCRSSPPLPSSPLRRFAHQPRGLLHAVASHPDPSPDLAPSLPPLPRPIHVRVPQAVHPLPASARGGGEGVASAWCFNDPERWVASYKVYSVEDKVDSSLSRGFCWIKAMCSELIHCWYKSFFWELFTQYFICIYAAVCKVPHFYILFLICVPIVFCNHRDNNISNYSVSCFQVLFLMYHYFTATEIYNAIRVFIATYVWMTGFGNFSYYYTKKDFSLARFAQVSILISGPVCSVHG
jgi:hypothetical protein